RMGLRVLIVGYGLGLLAAIILVGLLALSWRRRRYSSAGGAPLRGWLSAHVYMGLLPLAIVPMHASYRFGENVHTLAFALMALASLSGVAWGVMYVVLPVQLTRGRSTGTFEAVLRELGKIENDYLKWKSQLPHDVADVVDGAMLGWSLEQGLL